MKRALTGLTAILFLFACSGAEDSIETESQAIDHGHHHGHHHKDAGNISDDGSSLDSPNDAPDAPDSKITGNSCKDDDGDDVFTASQVTVFGNDQTCTTPSVVNKDKCIDSTLVGEYVCDDQMNGVGGAGQCVPDALSDLRFLDCDVACKAKNFTFGTCANGRCLCGS